MNGEIVEEGTHDELLHKKGKYLGLWSKQVSVKHAHDDAKSQSSRKADGDIANDLTPSHQKAELAKIMTTTVHEEPSTYEECGEHTVNESEQAPVGPSHTETETQMSPKGKVAAVKTHKHEVRDVPR
jgi:hypothetical protein